MYVLSCPTVDYGSCSTPTNRGMFVSRRLHDSTKFFCLLFITLDTFCLV